MLRRATLATLVLIVLPIACERAEPGREAVAAGPRTVSGALHQGAAAVCDPARTLLVSARRGDSTLRLNLAPYDSAHLAVRLAEYFRRAAIAPAQRVVLLDVDSSRAALVPPLIHMIERAGARAYAPDTACALAVPLAAI